MDIISFFDNKNDLNVEYSYTMRDSDEIYNPDQVSEVYQHDVYTKECGNLFFGKTIGWKDQKLLNLGVDINIDLKQRAFIDHLDIEQRKDSEIGSVEIFAVDGERDRKIGEYRSESGKNIKTEAFSVNIGYHAEKIKVRLNCNYKHIILTKFDLKGAINPENSIWPIPTKESYSGEVLALDNINTVCAKGDDEIFVAEYLIEKFKDKTGKTLKIVETNGDIVLKKNADCDKDSYKISSENKKFYIEGTGRRGLLYAVSGLVQLASKEGIRECEIYNEDFMELRGVHISLPDKDQVEFLKNMVKYIFIPNHYNMVFIQVAGAMKYDNFPKINETWVRINKEYKQGLMPQPAHYGFVTADTWEKSELRNLIDYFESFGLEVVPEIQTFGHTQYITTAYPELAERVMATKPDGEVDVNQEDIMPSAVYPHLMCSQHEDYYKVIFGIIDEVIGVFKPKRYIHLGHDEIYRIGTCKKCSKIPKYKLYAEEVTALHDHLKEKNLTMMIWSDMLQDMEYSTPQAINNIPKDIIMFDFTWYFFPELDIEDRLLDHGFRVVMGNMYSSHYTRYENRSKKKGIMGAEVSTWVKCSEEIYSFEGKMFDFAYSSLSICNKDYDSSMRKTYYEVLKPFLSDARLHIGGLCVDGEEKNVTLKDSDSNSVPFDIRGLVPYKTALILDKYHNERDIEIDNYAKVLTFTHATDKEGERVMWASPKVVAEYVINYTDGTTHKENITYGGNIYKYLSPYGDKIESFMFRHEGYIGTYTELPECGKTYNGEDYNLGHYSVKNPNPEKKIKSVTLSRKAKNINILLFDMKIKN